MSKVAFILAGEGAKAAYQSGCIKKLDELGIRPDAIYGISSGCLVGPIYSHAGLDYLEHVFKKELTSINDIFRFRWDFLWRQGLYDTKPLGKFLTEFFDAYPEPSCQYQVSFINMLSNHVTHECIKPGQHIFYKTLVNQIRSAVSIQFLAEPVHGVFGDAGMRTLVPMKNAIQDGFERLEVILASPVMYTENELPSGFGSFAKIGMDMIEYIINENYIADLMEIKRRNENRNYKKIRVRVHAPRQKIGGTLDFKRGEEFFNKGYIESIEYNLDDIFPSEG